MPRCAWCRRTSCRRFDSQLCAEMLPRAPALCSMHPSPATGSRRWPSSSRQGLAGSAAGLLLWAHLAARMACLIHCCKTAFCLRTAEAAACVGAVLPAGADPVRGADLCVCEEQPPALCLARSGAGRWVLHAHARPWCSQGGLLPGAPDSQQRAAARPTCALAPLVSVLAEEEHLADEDLFLCPTVRLLADKPGVASFTYNGQGHRCSRAGRPSPGFEAHSLLWLLFPLHRLVLPEKSHLDEPLPLLLVGSGQVRAAVLRTLHKLWRLSSASLPPCRSCC